MATAAVAAAIFILFQVPLSTHGQSSGQSVALTHQQGAHFQRATIGCIVKWRGSVGRRGSGAVVQAVTARPLDSIDEKLTDFHILH